MAEMFWALTPSGWKRVASREDVPADAVRVSRISRFGQRSLANGIGPFTIEETSPEGAADAAPLLARWGSAPREDLTQEEYEEAEFSIEQRLGHPVPERLKVRHLREALLEARWLRKRLTEYEPDLFKKG